MKTKRNWFQVDTEGLAQLQAGRPKWHIVRELVQNAFDEQVTEVNVRIHPSRVGVVDITVEDDCPEGFKDLSDAFTLFGETYKRQDPTKRGRFNLGEKQAIAQCISASIITTKGQVVFNECGRRQKKERLDKGSRLFLRLRATKDECEGMVKYATRFIAPLGVAYWVNGGVIQPPEVQRKLENKILKTVQLEDGVMKHVFRSTALHLFAPSGDGAWLYEMGIPVIPITCAWSVDVQQKIPLAMDRDSVRDDYLADVYAQILNETVADLPEAMASESWVRAGAGHFDCKPDTTKQLLQKRYGDKFAAFSPGDPAANDDAVANGYRVIHGNDLSAQEWERVRAAEAMPSTTKLFGMTPGNAKEIEPNALQKRVATLVVRIAKRCLEIDVRVRFVQLPNSGVAATYGGQTLTFVVNALQPTFFNEPTAPRVLDLIIHELAHEFGHHTERTYLDAATRLGGELVSIALKDPEFFNV